MTYQHQQYNIVTTANVAGQQPCVAGFSCGRWIVAAFPALTSAVVVKSAAATDVVLALLGSSMTPTPTPVLRAELPTTNIGLSEH